jgi:hypothetical protein
MKLMVLVLNKVEELEHILSKFELASIHGATILSSQGMAMALEGYMDGSFLGSLRAIMEPDREENKTVLTVLRDEQVPIAIEAIESVVGSLDVPNTGILFTVPIDYIKGIKL